jgi:asparagine synthase (glutamine-hydrolysing)
MPVYGSNDGALVLPFNNCDFTDYRPLLQLGSYLTKKKHLLEPGPWDEDVFWFYGEESLTPDPSPKGRRAGDEGEFSFPYGGIHLLRGASSKAVIRCTDFRSRPSHADQLHVDLWMRGQNIACDAGTYLYSGEGIWRNGLAHTAVHNTVTVDHQDQMKMLTRFTWTDWSKGSVLRHGEEIWQGEQDGYRRLADPVDHKRTVLSLGGDRWLVIDHLTASQSHHYGLHWLLSDGDYGVQELAPGSFTVLLDISDGLPSDSKIFIQTGVLSGNGNFSTLRADPTSRRGWRSQHYGHKEPAVSILLETEQPAAIFYTFFGYKNDALTGDGHVLKVHAGDLQKAIDLNSPSLGMDGLSSK